LAKQFTPAAFHIAAMLYGSGGSPSIGQLHGDNLVQDTGFHRYIEDIFGQFDRCNFFPFGILNIDNRHSIPRSQESRRNHY
jgi:hypothetical protein